MTDICTAVWHFLGTSMAQHCYVSFEFLLTFTALNSSTSPSFTKRESYPTKYCSNALLKCLKFFSRAVKTQNPLAPKLEKLNQSSDIYDKINIGNRTEWSPIRSVIKRVINKIGRPRPICWSRVWLPTELDDMRSCWKLNKTMTKFEKETRRR